MRRTKTLLALLVMAAWVQAAETNNWNQNWPHWRGPQMDGVAPHAQPPMEWSEEKNVQWKVDLPGEGSSTPIVWNNKVFVLTALNTENPAGDAPRPQGIPFPQESDRRGGPGGPEGVRGPGGSGGPGGPGGGRGRMQAQKPSNPYQFIVLCFDRNTGQEIWRKVAAEQVPHEGHHPTGSFASSSPITDGENVYASFGSRGIYCYSMDGELKWKQDLGDLVIKMSFGEGSSPFVYKDSLVVNWDHEGDSFLYRLNKQTGEVIWRVPRDEKTTWSSPIVVEHEGKAQIVTNATNRSRGYDFETGELLWSLGGQTDNPIPTTIVKDGVAYLTSGFRGAALKAVSLDAKGDITGEGNQLLWSYDKDTPYVPSPLLLNDRLYFIKGNSAILSSVDIKTGQPAIPAVRLDIGGTIYASPSAANGMVYIINREGKAVVLEQGDELKVKATNSLDDTFDASPVFVGKQLILRGRNNLYCIAES